MKLALGGTVVAFEACGKAPQPVVPDAYLPFLTERRADVEFHIRRGEFPEEELGESVFESGGNWTLHNVTGNRALRIHTPAFDPHQIVVLDTDCSHGDIYCTGSHWDDRDLNPLGYPLEEVLVVNLLAQGRGVLLHASGVSDAGAGLLFSGMSGAGKSTIATLWQGKAGVTALSDDRVIVRERDARAWAYGTPWHGSARISSAGAVPLERILLIQHADENEVSPLKPLEAVSGLLARAFPPLWDAEGMAFTLEFLERLVERVPCYELGFVPDESTVDFIRCLS